MGVYNTKIKKRGIIGKKNVSNDDLAIMVAKGFGELHGEIGEVKSRFGNVEENIKATRRDVLEIGDRFVPRYELDNLLV